MDVSKGRGDRLMGLVVVIVAVAYAVAASQLRQGFVVDPVGPKTFPYLVSLVCVACGLTMMFRPDPDPEWPGARTVGALIVAVIVLVGYAYAIVPLGFLIPTAIAATVLSYQIEPRPAFNVAAGIGLSLGLFALFKFVLDLGLVGLPKGWGV